MKYPNHFHDLEDTDQGIVIHYSGVIPPNGFDALFITNWLKDVLTQEDQTWHRIDYIFCSDQALLSLNKSFLQHDTLTDIITFPYQTEPLIAEIYISLERVQENAKTFSNGSCHLELARVMVHGILHLCGYDDHTVEEKQNMRDRESFYLRVLRNLEA